MTYSIITLEAFSVIGISVRTSNQNGQSQKDIGQLWKKFYGDNISRLIPNKASDDINCVYTDYESDADGAYTTILGCKVTTLANLPETFVGKTIPKATYRLYKSIGPDSVIATWQHIWQTPIDRRYLSDFDVYGPQPQNPGEAVVKTYLSVQ